MVCRDTNQPHLMRLVDDDLPTQYYVVVEQSMQMEVACIMKGYSFCLSIMFTIFNKNNELKTFKHKLLNM